MKKLAAIFLTLVFVSSASAQVISNPTSNARMGGLGVSNWQIEDDFNIWINPAQLKNYKNAVYGELGTDPCAPAGVSASPTVGCGSGTTSSGHNNRNAASAWGGMNMDAPYGGWGVYLGRPYMGPLGIMAGAGSGTAPTANRFDLFYATQGMPLGFYLSYAERSTDSDTGSVTTTTGPVTVTTINADTNTEASEINLGFGGLLMNNMLDVALNIGLPSGEKTTQSSTDVDGTPTVGPVNLKTEGDAGPSISLLARHHAAVGGNSKLLTTLQIQLRDNSTKKNDSTTVTGVSITDVNGKTDDTSNSIRLDTSLNSNPTPNTLLVAGIGIYIMSSEVKSNTTTAVTTLPAGTVVTTPVSLKTEVDMFEIPMFLGVEHQSFKKVKTRFGVSKHLYSLTDTKTTTSTTVAGTTFDTSSDVSVLLDGPAEVSMGLGWAVADNLVLDAVINQDVLFTGTYLISGVPETLNSMLSATYRFN